MESWLAHGRSLVELYLVIFSLLSQGVLVASTLFDLVGRVVPQLWGSVAIAAGVVVSVGVVLFADRLELLFVAALRLARAAERSGWRRLSSAVRRLLRRLVATSYVPVNGTDQPSSVHDLYRAFLTIYSSDAHYPRPPAL